MWGPTDANMKAADAYYERLGGPRCDLCGEGGDIRAVDHDDYCAPTLTCRECFDRMDGENDFNDLEKA